MKNHQDIKNQGLYHPLYEHDACGVGFLANIHGQKTHTIIEQAIEVLINLLHRGALGADESTGDGAGLLFQLPDEFFRTYWGNNNLHLPQSGHYGAGMVFLPKEKKTKVFISIKIIKKLKSYYIHIVAF